MHSIDREKAIQILKSNNVQDAVVEHCLAVSSFAKDIAEKIKSNGHEIDVDFVESAALLHDLGRANTHGIRHGIEGAAMLKEYPRYARVCENHIGGGIKKDEAERIGLPPRDYLPETLEEKVICYADKLVHGTAKASLDETLDKFRVRLGAHHPSIGRIKKLDKQIRELSGDY